jgi:hypothetical protein
MEIDAICDAAFMAPLFSSPAKEPASPVAAGLGSAGSGAGVAGPRGPRCSLVFTPSPLGRLLTPAQVGDNSVQTVTSQVENLNIEESQEMAGDVLQELFAAMPASILGTTPPSPPSFIQQARAPPSPFTPRRSARQANLWSSIPVAQRATVRIAKELKVVEQAERSAAKAAAALVDRFQEPLQDTDIDGLAILTRIDRDAIFRSASQVEAGSAAAAAH